MIFKVAKTGGSVGDDVKDLAFDSSQNYMIILDEFDFQTDIDGNYDLTHGLGYTPSFYIFTSTDNLTWTRPGQSSIIVGSYADNNKIYVRGLEANAYAHIVLWANSYNNAVGTENNNATGMLKVAKDGYSADIAKDLRQFVFASGQGFILIKEKKQFSITVSATYDEDTGFWIWNQSVQYAHGLDYIPQVQVFLSDGAQLPFEIFISGGNGFYGYNFTIDNTNLTIETSGSMLDDPSGLEIVFNSHIFINKITL